jgi:hypothetical protein
LDYNSGEHLRKSVDEDFVVQEQIMGLFNQLDFIKDEIRKIPEVKQKPYGGINSFFSRIAYAVYLAFKEKEIFTFCILQWLAIGFAYLLWVQMLDWIPEDVWRTAADSDGASLPDLILFAWSFVCVGVAAFPIGILSGCMGATHFLHKLDRESTIATCLGLVMPLAWSLWVFHWIDGWITVNRILERLPRKNDRRTAAEKAMQELMYYAWKVGSAGVLPGLVTGKGLMQAGTDSVFFVRENFPDVAKLRAGYSLLCWIVGVGSYVGTIFLFSQIDIVPDGGEVYSHIYEFYLWTAVPLLIATGFVMLILRPVYIISLCDLYSNHLANNSEKLILPDNPPKSFSALVAFLVFCLIIAAVYINRYEIGLMQLLSQY